MNKTQEQLMYILSNSIRGKNEYNIRSDIKSLDDIFNEAKDHKVDGFIYYYLNKNFLKLNEENKIILNTIKKDVFLESVRQSQHIKIISKVLEEFNKNNIPVIVLKGLVVRYLYPQPDLRTMSDADFLVHSDDLDKSKELLLSLGYVEYKQDHEHGAHVIFIKGSTVIEVHWKLINEDYYNGDTSFENSLWENTIKVKVEETETLSLGLEDLALHLCIHMAVHLACNGFGIRQLCDLVLLVEKLGKDIDWNIFLRKAEEANVKKFSRAIFYICNLLFNMEIPLEIKTGENIQEKYINLFINDIFENGVNGKRDASELFAKEFAFQHKSDENRNISPAIRFFKLIFPPIKKMNSKYDYAKKCIILYPVAWMHHLLEGIINNEYSFNKKIKILIATINISKKRNKLIKWLEL